MKTKVKPVDVLFENKDLTPSARIIHVALLTLDLKKKTSHKELSGITGYSVPTVKKAIGEMKKKNIIEVARTQNGSFINFL